MSGVKIYYWGGMLGRSSPAQLMLTAAGVEYEHVSEFPQIASKSAVFGAPTITIAPPILEYDGTTVSQSTAVTMFVGQKHFPAPAGQDAVALMLMANIVDLAEGGIGKNQKDAKGLKVYLDGADDGKPSRFSTFAGAIERAIAGPYFFGEEPSYVDFLATGLVGWVSETVFEPLKTKTGKDYWAEYPKLKAVFDGIMAMEKIQALDVPFSRADFRLTPDAESLALFAAAGADAAAGGAEAAAAPAAAPAAE